MSGPLFDQRALALRRARAASLGPELFLHDRILEDIHERLAIVRRSFRSLLIIGWPPAALANRLNDVAAEITAIGDESALAQLSVREFDLCIVVGSIDTFNDPPLALAILRNALAPGGLLIGAIPGGDSLPALRAAMRAADAVTGQAVPHVHPRIDAPGLTGLLAHAGFEDAVVDIDRVAVRYRSFAALIRDLRGMAATNVLVERSRRPLGRAALAVAARQFEQGNAKTVETIEFLHFSAWAPTRKHG